MAGGVSKALTFTGVALLVGACLLGLATAAMQLAPASAAPGAAKRKLTEISIVSIDSKPANPRAEVVLDFLNEGSRMDVELSADSAETDDQNVWLLVKRENAEAYQVFGPAKVKPTPTPADPNISTQPNQAPDPDDKQKTERFSWVVNDVFLSNAGVEQDRRFVFRAVAAPKDKRPGATVSSLDDFSIISWPPVTVVVVRWVPRAGRLTVKQVGDEMVEPNTSQVDAGESAEVRVEQAEAEAGGGYVSLILHPENSSVWRAVGPCEEQDQSRWVCRSVPFSEPGQQNWRHLQVFAVKTAAPLKNGPVNYEALTGEMTATSKSVRVTVKDDQEAPKVAFNSYVTTDGQTYDLNNGQSGVIKIKDVELSLRGTLTTVPPEGKLLRVLLNPIGTPLWVVQEGTAVVSGTEWSWPRLRLESPGDGRAGRFRLLVTVADASLQTGVVSYQTWQSKSLAVSPTLIVEGEDGGGTPPGPAGEVALSVTRIAGSDVDSSGVVEASGRGPVEVRAEGVPPGGRVWVGVQAPGRDTWRFFPAAPGAGETWTARDVSLGEAGGAGEASQLLTAIVAHTSLPVHDSESALWPLYAQATSPAVRLTHTPPKLQQALVIASSIPPRLLIAAALLILLGALVALVVRRLKARRAAGKRPPMTSTGQLGQIPIATQVSPARPAPGSRWWVLGLILLVVLYMSMGNFFIYLLLPLLALATLVALGRRFPAAARTGGEVRQACEAAYAYLRGQFEEVPKPHAVRSVLGLLLLGLGVFAVVGYLPIYEHILQKSLSLTAGQGHSLALLLIIFIALTGVVADVTTRYGRDMAEGGADPRGETPSDFGAEEADDYARSAGGVANFGYIFWVTLIGLIALALLMFQSILYLEFYKSQAAEGSQIPFALGAAALFIAGIEMLNFYWATRLALDFIAWLFIHVFLLAPPALLAKAASLVEQGREGLPADDARSDLSPRPNVAPDALAVGAPPVPPEGLSAAEAERLSHVYILTELGDHLRAGAPEQVAGGWRASVLEKETGQVQGELYVDGRSSNITWHPVGKEPHKDEIEHSPPTLSITPGLA